MLCDGWPYYNGGYPLSQIHWDREDEYYECAIKDEDMTTGDTADYCDQWLTLEDGDDEWEAGDCHCLEEAEDSGKTHCAKWSCNQIEVEKCNGKEYVAPGSSRYITNYGWGDLGWRWLPDAPDTNWLEDTFPGYSTQRRGRWDQFPYQCLSYDDDLILAALSPGVCGAVVRK